MESEEFRLFMQIVPYLVFGVIVGGSLWYSFYAQKKRKKEMQQQARQRGWEFVAKPTFEQTGIIPSLGGALFRSLLGVTNMLTRREFGVTWMIFDASTGSGKSKKAFNVVLAHVEDYDFPNFVMKPDTFLSNMFGSQKDIDIPGQPEFSKKYFIQGSDEHYIQQFFSPELVRYILQHDIKNPIFCSNNTLMILGTSGFSGGLTKADKIWDFFENNKKVLQEFLERADKMKRIKTF